MDKNEPAFPFEGGQNSRMQPYHGMSKREYAAIEIIAGIAASGYGKSLCESPELTAIKAVKYTDALFAELEKEA